MLDLAVLPDHLNLRLAANALPGQFLRHVHGLRCPPARPAHPSDVLLQLAHTSQKQMQRIEMLGPHFAYVGRRLIGSVRRLIALQSKTLQGLVEIVVIARVAVVLGAQGVAGDGC